MTIMISQTRAMGYESDQRAEEDRERRKRWFFGQVSDFQAMICGGHDREATINTAINWHPGVDPNLIRYVLTLRYRVNRDPFRGVTGVCAIKPLSRSPIAFVAIRMLPSAYTWMVSQMTGRQIQHVIRCLIALP